jgi:hypothetical protein
MWSVNVRAVVRVVVIQAATTFSGNDKYSEKALGRSYSVLCRFGAGCLTCYPEETQWGRDCPRAVVAEDNV